MRTVVLSCDKNPDYVFYVPIVCWAWNKLGWKTHTITNVPTLYPNKVTAFQCARLYQCTSDDLKDDDMLMTSDADMIPLSDYWNPDPDIITTYGHDLTDFKHIPICYIAMTKLNWKKVMDIKELPMNHYLDRDLFLYNTDEWTKDQEIITDKLNKHEFKNIQRGVDKSTGYPIGRVDRSTGCKIVNPLIDFHAPRHGWKHLDKIKEVLTLAFGEFPEWLDKRAKGYEWI